jgi:mannose-1-phosphate guanylyltransferase
LLPLTRSITGDETPKQFCAIVGTKTLLDQTRDRVKRLIKPAHTLIVLTKTHERFYSRLASNTEGSRLLVQPCNRGTAPAIAHSLAHLRELDPNATVAIFPSDHFFANENALADDLEMAFDATEVRPDRVMLLGVTPDYPEVEYGWIEPGAPLGGRLPDSVCHVACFWEKPSRSVASALMKNGCLWNSFLMIGKMDAFLTLLRRALPRLMGAFESIRPMLLTAREDTALVDLYSDLPSSSFSNEVLSCYPHQLAVISSRNPGWSDLGDAGRVLSILKGMGVTPTRFMIA